MSNKEYKLCKHSNTVNIDDNIWTTARCNRLLRSINTRIIALRKACRELEQRNKAHAGSNPRKRAAEDPSWLPQPKTKKTTRTYSGKSNPLCEKSSKPGQHRLRSVLPSPFVRRIRSAEAYQLYCNQEDSLDAAASIPEICTVERSNVAPTEVAPRRRKQITVVPHAPVEKAEQYLSAAFANFLASTISSDAHEVMRCGSRSLAGTCLRRIPRLLDSGSIEFDFDDAGEALDDSSNLYSYIEEEFENISGPGSPFLRQIVRSHGTELVRKAIVEGLLSDKAIRDLINICSERSASIEGDLILQTWLDTSIDFHKSHSDGLLHFCDSQNSNVFFFRALQHSLTTDLWRITQILQKHEKLCSAIPTGLEGRHVVQQSTMNRLGMRARSTVPLYEVGKFLEDCVSMAADMDLSSSGHTHMADLFRDLNSTAIIMTIMGLGEALTINVATCQSGIAGETVVRVAAQLLMVREPELVGLSEWKPSQTRTSGNAADINQTHNTAISSQTSRAKRKIHLSTSGVAIPYLISAFLVMATQKDGRFGVITLDALAAAVLIPTKAAGSNGHRFSMHATRFMHQFVKSLRAFDQMTNNNMGSTLLKRLSEAVEAQTGDASLLLRALTSEMSMRCHTESDAPFSAPSYKAVPTQNYSTDDQKENVFKTPSRKSPGYRWEDSISEWITATPKPGKDQDCAQEERTRESHSHQIEMSSPDALALSPASIRHKRISLDRRPLAKTTIKSRKALQLIERRTIRRRRTADGLCSGDELGL